MWKSHEIQTLDYAHHDPNSKDSLVRFDDDSDCGSTPLVRAYLQAAASRHTKSTESPEVSNTGTYALVLRFTTFDCHNRLKHEKSSYATNDSCYNQVFYSLKDRENRLSMTFSAARVWAQSE